MTIELPVVTPRQAEALAAIFLGHDVRYRLHPDHTRTYGRSMGGALNRMRESMGECGLLRANVMRSGRVYYQNELTALGLRTLYANTPQLRHARRDRGTHHGR